MATLHVADVLIRPMITEKNTNLTPLGQYTFEVAMNANKIQIREAIEKVFGVEVVNVNTMIVKPKKRRVFKAQRTTKYGAISAYKKAIVTLAPGDSIDIFGDI